MGTSNECVKDVKQQNPICAVAAELGLTLEGRRATVAATGQRLRFDPERHAVYDDATDERIGSVLDLLTLVEGISFDEAVERMQRRAAERGIAGMRRQGIILVDHGSRRAAANEVLLDVAAMLQVRAPDAVIHVAHMELAAPTIAEAFAACVKDGAAEIVVHPYFLAPGTHAMTDIPAQAEAAAKNHPDIPWRVTEPLGVHPAMAEVVLDRIAHPAA